MTRTRWEYYVTVERWGVVPYGISESKFYDIIAQLYTTELNYENVTRSVSELVQYMREFRVLPLDIYLDVMGEDKWELVGIISAESFQERKLFFKRCIYEDQIVEDTAEESASRCSIGLN